MNPCAMIVSSCSIFVDPNTLLSSVPLLGIVCETCTPLPAVSDKSIWRCHLRDLLTAVDLSLVAKVR